MHHDDVDEDVFIQDPGFYEVILPTEPYVFGTSHIAPRLVSSSIARPPYVPDVVLHNTPYPPEKYVGDGRVALGTEEETKLKAAAKLAKKTVDYAGTLIQVRHTLS